MTFEIGLVLAILVVSMVLFVTEKIRMDVVALLVLGATAITGLVSPSDALSGFSNPAVITVWAMFMLSAALARTGVASIIGGQVLRMSGGGEVRAMVVIMLTSAALSAFMNNIGVAALLLPVALDLARRTGRSPSRLLMPLAYGSLLGGLTTLVGTPPNILASESLVAAGFEGYSLFDFTPLGSAVTIAGVLFMVTVGRRLLPAGPKLDVPTTDTTLLAEQYALQDLAVVLRIVPGSALIGRTLEQTRLGPAIGVNLLALVRKGVTYPAPRAESVVHEEDRLVVSGRLDRFQELKRWSDLEIEQQELGLDAVITEQVGLVELEVSADSSIIGQTLLGSNFRRRFGGIVLAILRPGGVLFDDLTYVQLQAGDRLLLHGRREQLDALSTAADFRDFTPLDADVATRRFNLKGHIFSVRVPQDSLLVGKSLEQTRLGNAFRLGVLGIRRGGETIPFPAPETILEPDDRLMIRGEPDDLTLLHGLQDLELEEDRFLDLASLESDSVGLYEVMLSPRSSLPGRSLIGLRFRERYGFRILALLRKGRAIRSGLRDVNLEFGDAMLLLGPREKLELILQDPDFLMLTPEARGPVKRARAPLATAIMAVAMGTVLIGWLPISIASVVGATLMILTGCLTMDQAYRSVEWRSIFLIAGMLPLGTALQNTGAAAYIADRVMDLVGGFGPWGVIVGLYLLTAAATMIIPTAALIVLMAPIAFRASTEMGVAPQSMMMAVAMAASASFTSPLSHPANLLVMGPGGYKFSDYVKTGVPLTVVVFVVVMLLLPILWPLAP